MKLPSQQEKSKKEGLNLRADRLGKSPKVNFSEPIWNTKIDRPESSSEEYLRFRIIDKVESISSADWCDRYSKTLRQILLGNKPPGEDFSEFVSQLREAYAENNRTFSGKDSRSVSLDKASDENPEPVIYDFEERIISDIIQFIEKEANKERQSETATEIAREIAGKLLEDGHIDETSVSNAESRIQEVLQDILSGKAVEATASPSVPELRWSDDRQKGERPHEFILRAWGDGEQLPDWLDRPLLRKTDRALYTALVRQEGHADPEKRPPAGFHVPTKSEKIDRQLAEFERTGGDGLSYQERERLRSTRSSREHRTRK